MRKILRLVKAGLPDMCRSPGSVSQNAHPVCYFRSTVDAILFRPKRYSSTQASSVDVMIENKCVIYVVVECIIVGRIYKSICSVDLHYIDRLKLKTTVCRRQFQYTAATVWIWDMFTQKTLSSMQKTPDNYLVSRNSTLKIPPSPPPQKRYSSACP